MSRCEEIRPLLYPYLDEELGVDRAVRVKEHLVACPECERLVAVEGRFLARVAEACRESAPASLRSRVDETLSKEASGTPVEEPGKVEVTPIASTRWRRALVPVAAAAGLALLVLLRPWDGAPPLAQAASFAADHAAHAVAAPSAHPFPDEARVPPPPPLPGARLTGLSECVVDDATYAHYTYAIGDDHLSVFLPLGDAPLPGLRDAREGELTVVSLESAGSAPRAVLVSGELDADQLRAIWTGV
ncbi:MAG: zf-HC2 domain-containing protein [Gemmatimonadota bacterium]